MYLITYTIKQGGFAYGDRFLCDSCDYADILPEIEPNFVDASFADFRTAVADLRLRHRHEWGERILCDLQASKVDDDDGPILRKYLNPSEDAHEPVLASLLFPDAA